VFSTPVGFRDEIHYRGVMTRHHSYPLIWWGHVGGALDAVHAGHVLIDYTSLPSRN
jgi:hypothetical protein